MPITVGFTMDTSLRINRGTLDTFLNSPRGEVGRELVKRGRLIVRAAKRDVGVDTGKLRESIYMIHSRVGAYQQIWIGSDSDIALMHHEGTRPHAINARGPQMMRFSSQGRMVYTRHVNHPGTRPNNFLSDNLRLAYL